MPSKAVLIGGEVQTGSTVEVRNNNGFKSVFAMEHIPQAAVIFSLRGKISIHPTKYTIQLGWQRHLTVPAINLGKDDVDYCWQYLNHNCEPNGYIDLTAGTFRARRDIKPGEEITFNYLTTESEMAEPFDCCCGSTNCFRLIRGRNFLTNEQVDRLVQDFGEDNLVTLFFPKARKPIVNQGRRS
jgi:SET domain